MGVFADEHGRGLSAVGAVAGCGEQDPESVIIKVSESVASLRIFSMIKLMASVPPLATPLVSK